MYFYRFMFFATLVATSTFFLCHPLWAADGLDDVMMLNRRARVVTVDPNVVGDSSGSTETSDSGSKECTPGSGHEINDVNSPDGRGGWKEVKVGDQVVQTLPPNCLDEGSVKTWRNKDGEVVAVTYKDKLNAAFRANGYLTDIPQECQIVKVLDEGSKARIVWKKKDGGQSSCLVPSMKNISKPVSWTDSSIETSSDYKDSGNSGSTGDDDDDDDDSEGGSSDNGDEGTATGGDPDNDDVNLGDDDDDDDDNSGDDDDDDDDDSGSGAGEFNEPPPEREQLPDPPDNSFGVHPWLDDATVRAIVEEEIAKAQGAYKGPNGTQLNQWGAVIGTNGNTSITHAGGIDGYPTHVHYWVASNPAVRARLEKEGATLKAQITEEHETRYQNSYSAWLSRGGGKSPASTANNRPSSDNRDNISAGSGVPAISDGGSNFMSN